MLQIPKNRNLDTLEETPCLKAGVFNIPKIKKDNFKNPSFNDIVMGVLSRKKQAIARGWDAAKKQREDETKPQELTKSKEVSEEEHQKKMKLLEDIGLIKKGSTDNKEESAETI
jgi:hypothetical protein